MNTNRKQYLKNIIQLDKLLGQNKYTIKEYLIK